MAGMSWSNIVAKNISQNSQNSQNNKQNNNNTQNNIIFIKFNVKSVTPEYIYGNYDIRNTYEHSNFIRSTYKVPFPINLDNLPEDYYLICITYKKKDTQLSITGTIEHGEIPVNAAIREMEEEVGFTIDSSKLKNIVPYDYYNKQWYTYYINIRDVIPYSDKKIKKIYKKSDKKNRKVQICIYGNLENIKKALSQVYVRSREESDISGITLIKCNEIKKQFLQK
jgi:hypothetical protein